MANQKEARMEPKTVKRKENQEKRNKRERGKKRRETEVETVKFRNTGSEKAETKEQCTVCKSFSIIFLKRPGYKLLSLLTPRSYNISKVTRERSQKEE